MQWDQDKSPEPELRGAIAACRQFPVRIHLVGPEERIGPALKDHLRGERLPIEVVHASEWISMDDKAALSVRSKKDSSMRVGLKLVREGKARGFVTAGNTGAAMATAKMVLGTLAGVDRPGACDHPAHGDRLALRPARCRRQRRQRPAQPCPVRPDGADLCAQRAGHCQAARRPALDWRRGQQRQCAYQGNAAIAACAEHRSPLPLSGQCRGPRPVQRQLRCGCLRWHRG